MKQAILLIDNKNVQNVIETIFEETFSESIEYHAVSNDELLPQINNVNPEIVVIMVSEEGRKLMDIIRTIRRRKSASETAILVMIETASITESLIDGGATVVIESPISSSELINRIQYLLGIQV